MAKQKFYVVWKGRNPGVYETWDECQAQVSGFAGAEFKSFPSLSVAEQAFRGESQVIFSTGGKKAQQAELTPELMQKFGIIENSIAVDAACSGNPGLMEYKGVYTATGTECFHFGPAEDGTNNVGEFLALVHGLAWLKQHKLDIPIYSDSRNAIGWIQKKKCNTKLKPTRKNANLFELIARGEKWLKENTWTNKIIKWETKVWGEIPADFGRK